MSAYIKMFLDLPGYLRKSGQMFTNELSDTKEPKPNPEPDPKKKAPHPHQKADS